jgi:hypothetical protein
MSRRSHQRSRVHGGGGGVHAPSTDPGRAPEETALAGDPLDVWADPPAAAQGIRRPVERLSSSQSAGTEGPAIPSRRGGGSGAAAIVVALVALGAVVAGVASWYAFLRPSDFTAEALVAVLPDDPAAPDSSTDIAAVWVEVGNAPALINSVATGVGEPEPDVAEAVVISQPAGVPMLSIVATTSEADTSADLANAVAGQLIEQDRRGQVGHYHLQQVSEARAPAQHDSSVGLAGLAGATLLGGAGGGFLGRSIARRRQLPDRRLARVRDRHGATVSND